MKAEAWDKSGLVSDIQRFSLHDGPGIRTTVFLKGCNMRCAWCHNPEAVYPKPEYLFNPERCIGCGKCKEGCFSGARVLCGTEMTVREVLEEIRKEQPYFGEDGGVTVSGGEPGCQPEFTRELLRACREEGIHTAVETNMSLPEEVMRPLWESADLILADLKIWDEAAHKQWTGVGNQRIRENIRACSQSGTPIILHTPVVKGVNDSLEEITAIAGFAASLPSLLFYEMLPYHPLGLSKGKVEHFEPMEFSKPDNEALGILAKSAAKQGVAIRIAGKSISA